ncbi:beta/alpha barrel domain-containing protein [Stieleria varia]|uniref:Dihydroorotate dehydrogenase 2 n=1 Tax=Stieleria varia TaxID=2528005 RepID=A0A5C5ZKU7_9BACT|nr:dihydroorotate dehydrogenase [Stieleria varia]TWT87788.1 dihydroorotate dehydrogenase 2 [Stieleria varia]
MSADLTTHYGGLTLRSPVVVGACPLMANEPLRSECIAAGAGAIVLPSLFEEQVSRFNDHRNLDNPPPISPISEVDEQSFGHDAWTYLSFVNRCSVVSAVPVIASINGSHAETWVGFASELEEAGAAAIELNVYHSPQEDFADPRLMEDKVVDAVTAIRKAVLIPVFVKLCRQYTSVPYLVKRLVGQANGVVMFGRQPDVDICLDEVRLKSKWELTPSGVISHSLGMIMQTHKFCPELSIAASGGVGASVDVVRALLAGADVAMVTSAIYREGPAVIHAFLNGLKSFMETQKLGSMSELYSHRPLDFATDDDRARYAEALSSRHPPSDDLAKAQLR